MSGFFSVFEERKSDVDKMIECNRKFAGTYLTSANLVGILAVTAPPKSSVCLKAILV